MVAEGGGQQFKISVSPLSKTLQGSAMAAVLVLNSAGQHQLVAVPSMVGGGGGVQDHKVLPKVGHVTVECHMILLSGLFVRYVISISTVMIGS